MNDNIKLNLSLENTNLEKHTAFLKRVRGIQIVGIEDLKFKHVLVSKLPTFAILNAANVRHVLTSKQENCHAKTTIKENELMRLLNYAQNLKMNPLEVVGKPKLSRREKRKLLR